MPDTPLVTGIQLIAVYVTDLDRAVAFYTDILGFTKGTDMPPGLILNSDKAMIYLEPGRAPTDTEPNTTREVSAVFATQSVAAARKYLEEKQVRMIGEYQQFGDDFAFFRFADPDGNAHEFGGKP
jgi:catechol 2,3-dioxygenase-like lactoylglutathione lyase family enzyme